MSRLVDYFVVVGFDHEKERGGVSSGVILQRFPEVNWEDTPFHDGIEWFCQPQGWSLATRREEPKFYVSVLTDVDAERHYCACLCFSESVAVAPAKPVDEEEEALEPPRPAGAVTHHSVMYAPKCLVIVSRQDCTDTFRNCLGIIYTVWAENLGVPLETLVGNLLGCALAPPPGGPQVRFSIGAGDRQALTPCAAPPAPVTRTAVYTLLRLLGIHNSATLWCALMSEHKVLLLSLTAGRLSAAATALCALMFPFRYAHVYIPLLPTGLAEVLATPTPFLIGLHSSVKGSLDLLDVIIADLDVGSLHVPPTVTVPRPEPRLLASLQSALATVLQPDIRSVDAAFAPPPPATSPPHMLDKEIRAVFMRTLAKLLQGYRHCLTLIRIHPTPTLAFHRAGFLGARGLAQCQFTQRLLDSMFFNTFVAERGPPWRPADIWDELMLNLPEQLRLETANPELELQHIQELAAQLHLNENPGPQTYQQRILRPPEGASARIHQPPFPPLDAERVAALVAEHAARNAGNPKLTALRAPQPRIIPLGAAPAGAAGEHDGDILTNSARRLEVLQSCVTAIFEGRCADARKSLAGVTRALRAAAGRAALLRALAGRAHGATRQPLQHQQFELLVRLMNCALSSATEVDEHSVAAAMLPLATAFCRKLCTGVIQYAYMCIQEHQIWTNQQFWEAAFYQDVQKDIKALYLPSPTHRARAPSPREESDYIGSLLKAQEPSALEIAAEQMRLWPSIDPEKQKEMIATEESTLYSQAIHYASRMVYLLLPPDRRDRHEHAASHSNTNSAAESDSADCESGFEETDPGEAGNNVIKMVSRFVDKVCTEGGVLAAHVRSLHAVVPGVLHMHCEALDAVARESRRLPPVQKPRVSPPPLLAGETLAPPALRALLAPDGRGGALLPAEGALFLTNYRVIFKGAPVDPYACEQTVIRSMPVSALSREKSVRASLPHLPQSAELLQLRSNTFQLIKVALDEEVTAEQLESFRKQLAALRHPESPLQYYACAGRAQPPPDRAPAKHATLKGFAKKTLLKTARRAGLKPKQSKRQKYVLPAADARSLTSPPLMSSLSADTLSMEELETASAEAPDACVSDARTLERLRDRAYARDWARLGLAAPPFRLSHCNVIYTVCRSYPALIPVPESLSDESIRRVARCYRQGRLPVVTWRHPRTGALLLRSGGCHHKGVIGMLKASHQTPAPQPGVEPTSSIEQERYMATLTSLTASSSLADSSLSLDSLLLGCEEPATPPLAKAARGVLGRNSGGKGGAPRHFGRWGSLKGRQGSHLDLYAPRQRLSTADNDSVSGEGSTCARRAWLYAFCERGAACAGAEPVAVEYPDARACRHAYKKLTRACVPSGESEEPGFYKLIEDSGWLSCVRTLLQTAGAAADLLGLQGSSLLVSLEDGGDVTSQITSLAQLLLEPYYRTLDGFRVLIEKEWLALGHRFQARSDLGAAPQQYTPVFLMFLDCVHQIQKQFPLAFEFNDFYLRFLAYHHVSCRFRTFLLDSECARAELRMEDRRSDARLGVETGCGSEDEGWAPRGVSIFDFVERAHAKSPVFYNFLYTPDLDNPTLRPVSSLAALEVWEYYTAECLGGGAPYELLAEPDAAAARRPLTAGYDNLPLRLPSSFAGLLERARRVERARGLLPRQWRTVWDQLELPHTQRAQRNPSMCSVLVRAVAAAAHRRATLRVVGRRQRAHRWSAAPPGAACARCGGPALPLQSLSRCSECGAAAHTQCGEMLPPCRPRHNNPEPQPHAASLPPSSAQYYEQFSSNVAEDRTHEGHLYKRGALLKGWKQRWFVLDSIKHQLRYYDAMEDSHCKGFIELGEVVAVAPAPAAPGPPKKCDERSFFDLRTNRRTYNFCASDAASAQEWIEKLQACLQ